MNFLITGAWQQAREYITQFEEQGHHVVFMQFEKDELPCEYDWVEGVICNGLFLTHPIEKFVNLKYIQLTSAGFDRVPMEYIQKREIRIYNARGVYSVPMAEFAIGGVLQLCKQSKFFYEKQKEHRWEKHRGIMELYGKTVCIVGCGSVGTECAKRFKAFGCRVVGVDKYIREDESYERMISLEKFEKILSEANVLVLTVPLTEETKYLLNGKKLALMKKGSVIVNIARGMIVEERALVKALSSNLAGAVLDVFEEEPLKENHPLWEMENVILTPHNSFVGDGNAKRLADVILENLKRTI